MLKIKKQQLFFLLSVLLYIFALEFLYKYYLYPKYEYFGYKFVSSTLFDIILSYFLILIPSKYLYRSRNLVSKYYIIYIYLIIYVPTLIFINHIKNIPDYLIFIYKIIFFIGIMILIEIVNIKYYYILNISKIKINKIYKALLIISIIYAIYILFKYRRYFSFLSFDEIYDKRNTMGISKIDNYFYMWISNLVLPIILVYGIIKKKTIYTYIAIICYIIIYAIFSSKISIFSFLTIILFSSLNFNKNNYITKISFLLSLSIILLTIISIVANSYILSLILSILLMRTIGLPGLLTVQYMIFFYNNSYTYYSHINIINALIYRYPYDRPLGFVIGRYFTASDYNNANANFLATDGIAALGPLGIVIISFIFGILLKILDSITRDMKKRFIYLSSTYFIFTILNGSMFTTLLSGGLLFYMIFFILFSTKRYGLKLDNEA